ncbi:MAG: hypothetical protein ACLFWD_04280 [Anaerolineales bacterium]
MPSWVAAIPFSGDDSLGQVMMRNSSIHGDSSFIGHGLWAGALMSLILIAFHLVDFTAGWDSGVVNLLTLCVIAIVPVAGIYSAVRLRDHEIELKTSTLAKAGGVAGLLAGTIAVLSFFLLQIFPVGIDGKPYYGHYALLELILVISVFAIPTALVTAGFSAVASIVTGALLSPLPQSEGFSVSYPKRSNAQRKGFTVTNPGDGEKDKYVKWSKGPIKVRSKKEEIEDSGENYYRWLLGHFGRKTLRRLIAVVVIIGILFLCSLLAGLVS